MKVEELVLNGLESIRPSKALAAIKNITTLDFLSKRKHFRWGRITIKNASLTYQNLMRLKNQMKIKIKQNHSYEAIETQGTGDDAFDFISDQ